MKSERRTRLVGDAMETLSWGWGFVSVSQSVTRGRAAGPSQKKLTLLRPEALRFALSIGVSGLRNLIFGYMSSIPAIVVNRQIGR